MTTKKNVFFENVSNFKHLATKIEFRLDVSRATNGAHIEMY
jgi:hypothetical protein